MSIRCGSCKDRHNTPSEVRACYTTTTTKETPVQDVNEQFATQRIAQIEEVKNRLAGFEKRVQEGSMRRLTDGRFMVTSGWDSGEVFNAQGEPVHGLDHKVYLKDKPAWHSFANVIPGGLSDGKAVLRAGGGLYDVIKVPAQYTFADEVREMAGQFINVRTDTGAALGAVGSQYTPLQNLEAYEMLDELIGYGMVAETMGTLNGGAKIFVSTEIPEPLVIDPQGVGDVIRQFLMISNSHDGKSPITACITPWRPVCRNTERLALANAVTKWTVRHTKNAKTRIEEAKRALGLTHHYFSEFAAEETSLLQTPVRIDEISALIDEIWEAKKTEDDMTKRAVTIRESRRAEIYEIYEIESARVGKNLYAAERAVTGWIDHLSPRKPRGDMKGSPLMALGAAIVNDTDEDLKNRVHRKMMSLINR